MRKLIKHILKESFLLTNILDVIKNEGIFVAAEMVGGLSNLKKILKPFPDLTDMLDSFKGKLNLIYHSRKEYIEFPFRFEIVGIAKNKPKTNSWPILNFIYDDSKLNESDKKLLKQFIYDSIADLNIGKLDIEPEVINMYKDKSYVAIDFVNGKNWESLNQDFIYNDNDIKNLHREYYIKSYVNESKILQENDDNKVKLVKQMIYDFFDEVSFIEESIYDKRPLLTIYFDSDDPAANIESWMDNEISKEIRETTNGNIVVIPYYWNLKPDYWKPDWFWDKKNADIFINSKKLKYDNLGNVINESDHQKNKFKTPIKYFYRNFLNEQPIKYKGIILQPTYHEEYDTITWNIENPEDYSFNGELIKNVMVDEFIEFCSFVSLDFYGLYNQINVLENMPKNFFYLNKNDKKFIETTLKNKKTLEFTTDKYEYFLNFDYTTYVIDINMDIIGIRSYGNFSGFKINLKSLTKEDAGNDFYYNMTESEDEEFKEYFLFDNFYFEILNHLRTNPRFYNPDVDIFDLDLWPN